MVSFYHDYKINKIALKGGVLNPLPNDKDLPGPLANYPGVQIEDEQSSYRLTDVINQLALALDIRQETNSRRDAKLNSFLLQFRAWKSQLPDPDVSQQEEIQELTKKLDQSERSYSNQLQKTEELEQNLKLYQSQIEQLQQQLSQVESQNELERIKPLSEKPIERKSPLGILLKTFSFAVLTVDQKGQQLKKETSQAEYFIEDLGNYEWMEMVSIPEGKFLMGTEDGEIERLVKKYNSKYCRSERPQHEVTVQPFYMGKYSITQAQWKEVAALPKVKLDLKASPSKFPGDNLPVEQVDWDEAVEFCQRLSKKTGKEYRLPSEAEWEYACRAVTSPLFKGGQEGSYPPYYFGETITGALANYRANTTYAEEAKGEYREKTTVVGSFPPNNFGLYDMHGNVWEWCQDDWHQNYDHAPTDGRAWFLRESSKKVVRGGSWLNSPLDCRSALRSNFTRAVRSNFIGFRVVCVVPRAT